MLDEVGVTPAELSVFVIPYHEGRIAVDQHAPTLRFLRGLADRGATLVMHGLTHRMAGWAWTPRGFARGHIFARGQGELLRATAADTARCLEDGSQILRRAGLAQAARAFVPPAWLLSPAARQVVREAGFDFFETFAGIVKDDQLRARRVIGWGSLNAVEAFGTSVWARMQCARAPADTRLAVHPADMRRPGQRKAVRHAITRLLPRMHAQSYARYLCG